MVSPADTVEDSPKGNSSFRERRVYIVRYLLVLWAVGSVVLTFWYIVTHPRRSAQISLHPQQVDVKDVYVGSDSPVSFVVRNNTSTHLSVRIIPDCSCTSVNTTSVRLPPGRSHAVSATVHWGQLGKRTTRIRLLSSRNSEPETLSGMVSCEANVISRFSSEVNGESVTNVIARGDRFTISVSSAVPFRPVRVLYSDTINGLIDAAVDSLGGQANRCSLTVRNISDHDVCLPATGTIGLATDLSEEPIVWISLHGIRSKE